MLKLRDTPSSYIVPGILWTVVAIIALIEREFNAGHIVFIGAAIIYYTLGLIVFIKNKKRK